MFIAAGSHFHRARAVSLRPLERFDAVGAVRVDRRGPFEVARVRARHLARPGVGYPEARARHVRPTVLAVRALEGEENELRARPHAVEQILHALDVGEIDARRRLVHAAGVEEEEPARVLARVEEALHLRVDEDAARRIARADEVRVRIPDGARIEPLPGRLDELVLGKPLRQGREAAVPEPFIGPEAPSGERTGGCRRRAAEEKLSSFQDRVVAGAPQAGQFSM
ncbi:MAG: hypothetical protein RML56_02005 [Burkholderiales bacterium]|nr:hypothetical protein [Burkholderiales bacterium]